MYLTDAQLGSELQRCEFCEEKPCKTACPCDCSPADFIMAAKGGRPSDLKRAAGMILASNPLGGVCGVVCPDYHCQQACSRELFDSPINIPAVQASIIRKAREMGLKPEFERHQPNGKRIGIIGAGPAGIACAVTLIQRGYAVDVYESDTEGGMCNLIPDVRLEKTALATDLEYLAETFGITIIHKRIDDPEQLKEQGYDAIVIACGLDQPIRLNIPGDEYANYGMDILRHPEHYDFEGKRIALVGGAIAADQALTIAQRGAAHVEMITLESYAEMPLTEPEKLGLIRAGVQFSHRMRIKDIIINDGKVVGIIQKPVHLPTGEPFHPSRIKDEENCTELLRSFDMVVIAIGNRPSIQTKDDDYYRCGDMAHGPTTVVEAIASGKNTALRIDADLSETVAPQIDKATKSQHPIWGFKCLPVPLTTDFFGRKIDSPFLLSAAPPTDGYEQMKKAYDDGWAGGVMKTAFDDLPIHIPGEYMFVFDPLTYANCDNVSEHPLDRVCEEIKRLVEEYPNRLTMASTGGPVTGNDKEDKAVWQSNTRKLEAAGAMGIEYSLSCPQGGDGTHGDIVAQSAELTAKIIDWVMEISAPEIPKLFKLTGAVTAIVPIIIAVKSAIDRYPHKKAGITLANTFPCLAFREVDKGTILKRSHGVKYWDEGIVVGMSGAGVLPISYLTLARAGGRGVYISGNGGVMDYQAAANFLALGAGTVQCCTIAEKYGLGIIDELKSGLSYYLEAKGLASVKDLTGIAQPHPVTDFMDLPPKSMSSTPDKDLCVHCGNCTRCPYLAIELDEDRLPRIDREKCVGCSLCVQNCFAGALYMSPDDE